VRLREVAEVLQVRHHVAQAGGREREPAALGQHARADRLTAGNVLQHDLPQHLAGADIEVLSMDIADRHHVRMVEPPLALKTAECQAINVEIAPDGVKINDDDA
jgi:hypothetical protein